VIDIDMFKSVNDRFGHRWCRGTRSLFYCRRHLRRMANATPTFSPASAAEEFALLLPETDIKEAPTGVAERTEKCRCTAAGAA